MNTKMKILCSLIMMFLVTAVCLAAPSLIDQRGVLTGQVLADNLAAEGMLVQVGTPLVMIQTPVGPVAATRANVKGIVRQVLVAPGDMIRTGEVLVRIEPMQRK